MSRFEHDPAAFHPFSFDARVERHEIGSYRYTVVFLDADAIPLLPLDEHPRLRVSGELGEAPFEGAWQPVRGRWYLMLSKRLLKEADLAPGDTARVRFRVEDQDAVAVPPELLAELERDDALRERWDSLSAGKRRGFAHRVSSAKRAETRERRVAEVVDELLED